MKQLTRALLLLIPLGAFAAEVYRSIDADGVVVYSDRPTGAPTEELLEIRTFTPAAQPAAARPAATGTASAAAAAAARLTAEIPRESTPEEIAADRARNCEAARARSEAYETSHRLYRNGPDGEREYLTSEEIDEARATAANDVAAWCD